MKNNLIFIALNQYPSVRYTGFGKYSLDHFSKKFGKIYIFCPGINGIHKVSNKVFISGSFTFWVYNLLKLKSNISHVYINDWFIGGILGVLFSKYLKCSLVMRSGSPWRYKINTPLKLIKSILVKITKPIVIKNCKKIVYNSKSIIQKYNHNYAVVYNGIDTELFKPKQSKTHKKLKVLFIGRICEEKGLDYLFSAIKDIEDQITLSIIGEGELYNHYAKTFRFAKFLGQVKHSKLQSHINDHDCIILPTITQSSESFPNVLLEAMSCAKPVIGTRVWGIPEMIKNNYNGLLIEEKSSQAIKDALLKLRDKNVRLKLGKNGRTTVLKQFKLAPQIEKLYKSLFEDTKC
jgi:L-malate glycosyltransferase